MFNTKPASWHLKHQVIVAFFLIEAKYVSLILVVKEAIWLRFLLTKLNVFQPTKQYTKIKIYDIVCLVH